MIFEGYGELEYLEQEDFYSEAWSLYDKAIGEDGILYDIVISCDKTELRYTCI